MLEWHFFLLYEMLQHLESDSICYQMHIVAFYPELPLSLKVEKAFLSRQRLVMWDTD